MRSPRLAAIAACCTLAVSASAQAQTVVTPGNAAATGWFTSSSSVGNQGFLYGNTTGSAQITSAAPDRQGGGGSLEVKPTASGDRVRYVNQLATPIALANLTSLGFDWFKFGDSPDNHFSPAFRLHIRSENAAATATGGFEISELIWEDVYNGGASGVPVIEDRWYTEDLFTAVFHRFVNGGGVNGNSGITRTNCVNSPNNSAGAQLFQTLAQWQGGAGANSCYAGRNAEIFAISVGAGSSGQVHGAIDRVSFGTASGTTSYDFEVTAAVVPEPSTYALMGTGLLGLAGAAARRRRRSA